MKKTFILFYISILCFSFEINNEVRKFGFYSNEISTDGEHSHGYTLQLWKYKNSLIGKLSYNEGLIGDQVSDYISNVNYNSKNGSLYFETALDNEKVNFNGKILKSKIIGTFKWNSKITNKESLGICCSDAEINIDYRTLDKWKKMWQRFDN